MSAPDETAALIRAAILDLAGLLTGGAGISCRVNNPGKGDLATVNPGLQPWQVQTALDRAATAARLAKVTATGEPMDDARRARDLAFIKAADARHGDEGVCEIDTPADPLAIPLAVSAAENIAEAGGAYVQAWVWIDLADVAEEHRAEAAAELAKPLNRKGESAQ